MNAVMLIAGIAIGIIVAAIISGVMDEWMNGKKKDR